ncbi:uncharacterized protein MYCFIDRAFT_178382 [Pseudocercospora fijiensis CIRAD86]|uniref:Uncharacterized protein n=1 Tax=Pseudocercospora fijiensis (strain CIRAD86) TaxID=383855 RepID=M2ZLA2_PSEFD|nr:uncharacterized protein MYCFIDRAFT_178382 [Pseudocercospora fijiensis CIRAD86]EME79844.1 hypothetical protein MYCFIDRAFT_178382 [Pseudocercospora fijiensis CIRAD86]
MPMSKDSKHIQTCLLPCTSEDLSRPDLESPASDDDVWLCFVPICAALHEVCTESGRTLGRHLFRSIRATNQFRHWDHAVSERAVSCRDSRGLMFLPPMYERHELAGPNEHAGAPHRNGVRGTELRKATLYLHMHDMHLATLDGHYSSSMIQRLGWLSREQLVSKRPERAGITNIPTFPQVVASRRHFPEPQPPARAPVDIPM